MDEEYWKILDTLKLIKIAKEERKSGVLGETTITKDYINHLSTNVNLMREGQMFGEKKKLEEVMKVIDEFFDAKQKQIDEHVELFGKEKNREIDGREKFVFKMLPIVFKKDLKLRLTGGQSK